MTGKDIVTIAIKLAVIYIIGGIILAVVYARTSPIIYKYNQLEKEQALMALLPEADTVEKLGDWEIHRRTAGYYVAKKGDEIIGYIVQSFGRGYASYINTLVAVDKDFKILKIDIIGHAETPGFGEQLETDFFKNKFIGKTVDQMKVVREETDVYIETITGVTVSVRAVAEDAVKNGILFLKERLKGGPDAAKQG